MKVLFVSWAGGGNSTPVLGLATRLQGRGHRVKAVSPDDEAARFASVGVDHERFDRAPGAVLQVIEREQPDAVLVDFMMPVWMSEAEASGVPWVALAHTLFDRMAAGLLTAFISLDAINAARAAIDLDPLDRATDLLDRAARVLVTAPRRMEDPAAPPPANVTWVGTILEEMGPDAGWAPPFAGRPLLAVGLGTTVGLGEEAVLQRVLDAVADLDVHAVVNLGSHLRREDYRAPANVELTGYVRHAAVLPHVDVMVNHAGLGSVLAALAHGVPMVCIPLDRDQPHNASRVDALGVGAVLGRDASTEDIRAAITRVLGDDHLRAAARSFVLEYDPTAAAALTQIEQLGEAETGPAS